MTTLEKMKKYFRYIANDDIAVYNGIYAVYSSPVADLCYVPLKKKYIETIEDALSICPAQLDSLCVSVNIGGSDIVIMTKVEYLKALSNDADMIEASKNITKKLID